MGLVNREIDASGPWTPVGWKPSPGQVIAICDRCHIMIGHPYAMKNSKGRVITVGCDSQANAETNAREHADKLARLDKLSAASGFAGQFAKDVATRMRAGQCVGMSDKQLALLAKLEAKQG